MLSIVFGEFHYAWNKCIFFEMYWLYFSHVCLFNVLFNWTKFEDLAGVARADQGSVKAQSPPIICHAPTASRREAAIRGGGVANDWRRLCVKGIAYFYVGNGKGVAYFFKVHQANSNSL